MHEVEILLAAHNGAAYVARQIDSILAQSDGRWHLTLSDDGSQDGTKDILEAYARRWPGRITHHVSGRRFGCARDHFFYLIARCEARYMMLCDQDDVWLEDKVRLTLDALMACGEETPALVFTDVTPADAQLREIAPSLMAYQRMNPEKTALRSLLLQNVVTGCAAGFNRALAQIALECRDVQGVIMHDWWLAAAAARFGRIVYLPVSTALYRQHGANSVGAKDAGSIAHIAERLAHPGRVRRAIMDKKRQAQVFAATYADRLDEADRAFISGFSRRRSGPLFYWRHRKCVSGFFRLAGLMALG